DVPPAKLVVCRQGLARWPALAPPRQTEEIDGKKGGVLRLGYFGRLDPAKGIDIVIEALRRVPNVLAQFEIYGVRQPGFEGYAAKLEDAVARDPRISLMSALPSHRVSDAIRNCDLIV